ncbi:MAG: amidohydrolase family protein [Thermoleophilia bacterium]
MNANDSASSTATPSNGPIVDVHVHIFSPEVIRERQLYTKKDTWFRTLYADPASRMVSFERVLEEMDSTGVDRSVIFGFAYHDQGLCRETNDYVIEAVRAHPDRFTGLACVSPEMPGALRELERCLDSGLHGCGELFPDGQEFSLEDSAGLDAIAGVLAERGLPLNIHANEPVGHEYPGKGANTPGPCYEFARRHPELTIVLAHLGGGLFVYEMMSEVRRVLANVYYDTSASPYLYGRDIYSVVAATAGPRKLLFGSDYPLLSPGRYLRETEDLDRTLRRAIFGGNAVSVLGLEGPEA